MATHSAPSLPPFYVTGGTLPATAQSYVERQADRELVAGLAAGEFCYVLDTRQMGKSSLMIRTAERLRSQGARCAILDLTGVGQNLTPDRWYAGLLSWLDEQLEAEGALLDYWREHKDLGGLQRFIGGIRLALMRQEAPLVIFVDEIDAVRSLPFSADEFFAGVRECYNRRTQDAVFQRLTFCLLGVATPADLISDARISPFNIGRRVVLTDFSAEEAAPLAEGLSYSPLLSNSPLQSASPGSREDEGARLLARVLYWTGGHPYLTQRLCRTLSEQNADIRFGQRSGSPAARVDPLCERLFLSKQARETDDNLMFVRNSLLRSGEDLAGLLDLYSKIRAGRRVADDETDPLQSALRLAGVIRSVEGAVRLRNRIYDHVFDPAWVRSHMPDAEVRRQRSAYRRGLLRATGVAAGILVIMSVLAVAAIRNAAQARAAQAKLQRLNGQLSQMFARQQQTAAQRETALRQAKQNQGLAQAAQRDARQKQLQAEAAERRAQGQRQEALAQEEIARRQKGIAQQQRAEARLRLSQTLALNGTRLLEQGDPLNALRPLTEALRLEERDAAPEARRRCAGRRSLLQSALARTPALLHLWTTEAPVTGAEYRADGQRVVIIAGTTVRILNAVNGATVAYRRFSYQPTCAMFDPAGARVAVAGAAHDVEVCRPETLRPERRLPADGPVTHMNWSHDGRWLGIAGNDGSAVIDVATSRKIVEIPTGGNPNEVVFSPADTHVAIVSRGFITVICPLKSVAPLVRLPNSYNSLTAAFSPDGRTVLVQGDPIDSSAPGARIYDVKTGQLAAPLFAQTGGGPARFSPDGNRIVVGDRKGILRVWDVATGEAITPAMMQEAAVLLAQFSRDGQRILSADADGDVQAWDARTGDRIGPLLHHGGSVRAAAFTPDGWHVLIAGDDQTIRVWDLRRTLESHEFSLPGRPEHQAELLKDGTRLLIHVTQAHTGRGALETAPEADRFDYQVFDVGTGKRLIAPPTSGDSWRLRAYTVDGRRLALAGAHAAQVWDVATGRTVGPLIRTEAGWDDVAISPDGDKLLLLKRGDHAELHQVTPGRLLCALPGGPGNHPVGLMAGQCFSRDSRYAAVIYPHNALRCVNVTTGADAFPPLQHESKIWQIVFSPHGQRLFTVTEQGMIRLWNAVNGRLIASVKIGVAMRPQDFGVVFALGRDGRRAVTCLPQQRGAYLWDLLAGKRRALPMANDAKIAVFGPGDRTVTLCGPHRATLCDASTGRSLQTVPLSDPKGILISPNGERIATYGDNGQVTVWDAGRARRLCLLPHPQRVTQVAFSQDGHTLATCCVDFSVRVWNPSTGEMLFGPETVPDISLLLFTPDAQKLIVSGWHENRIIHLTPSRHSSEELRQLALLLTGPPDATSQPPTAAGPATLQAVWRSVFGKRPPPPTLNGAEERFWRYHVQSAERFSAEVTDKNAITRRLQLRDEIDRAISAPAGDREDWLELARECLRAGQWEWAASAATRAPAQASGGGGEARYLRAVARERQGHYEEALKDINAAMQLGRNNLIVWRRRANLKAALGQWEQGATDYRQLFARIFADPDFDPEIAAPLGYQYALLLLRSGNVAEYRRFCAEMLKHYSGESAYTVQYIARTCSLAPDAVADLNAVVTLARSAAGGGDHEAQQALALALIRAGRPVAALQVIASPTYGQATAPADDLIGCLAQVRSGDREAARPTLERVKRSLTGPTVGSDLAATEAIWRSIEAQQLYDEMAR